MLERLTAEQADAEIAMRATSDGQYVDFNFRVIMNYVEGLEEDAMAMLVYPNPTNGMITVHLDESQSFDYEVYNLMGQCVLNGQAQNGSAQIDLSSCHQGVYFVAVSWGGSRVIRKVMVQ